MTCTESLGWRVSQRKCLMNKGLNSPSLCNCFTAVVNGAPFGFKGSYLDDKSSNRD